MKIASLCRSWIVVSIFLACVGVSLGQDEAPERGAVSLSAMKAQLATQVRSIAASRSMSSSKKESYISTAVRVAIVAATAYDGDPGQTVATATALAATAARAAPAYANAIAKAAAYAPSVVRLPGAGNQIRIAALAAAKGRPYRQPQAYQDSYASAPRRRPPAAVTAEQEQATQEEAVYPNEPAPTRARSAQTQRRSAAAPSADEAGGYAQSYDPQPNRGYAYPEPAVRDGLRQSDVTLSSNSTFRVTADASAQANDNVFLTNTQKKRDTMLSVTPGLEYEFGQTSLAKGSLAVHESFTRYADNSAPSAHLANAAGSFAYPGDRLSVTLSGAYQQLYQNNADYTVAGEKQLLRTDLLNFGSTFEAPLTAKISGQIGAAYSQTKYKTDALIGNKSLSLPLAFFFQVAPKLDLSTGFTYSSTKPDKDGPEAKDLYYNVGARGSFTSKLTGNFSVGYRRRQVDEFAKSATVTLPSTKDSLLGFDGSFNYQATEKTTAVLSLSRNFGSSALGQSTKGSSYGLALSNHMTPQLVLSAKASYRTTDYGEASFNPNPTQAASASRKDSGWENSLSASYAFTNWFTMAADYTFRNNRSTYDSTVNLPVPDYNNNVISLTIGLQY